MKHTIILLLLLSLVCVACKNKGAKTAEQISDEELEGIVPHGSIYDENELKTMSLYRMFILKGKIGNNYEFIMNLDVDSINATGNYKYINQKNSLSLTGTFDQNQLKLEERLYNNDKYTTTGWFEGTLYPDEGSIKGNWYSADRSKTHPFELHNYIGGTYPQYTFKSDAEEEDFGYDLSKIVVYDDKGSMLQTLYIEEANPIKNWLTLQDINFDGYQDLALMQHLGARSASFIYWLYNPQTKQFDETSILDDIPEPYFDYENLTVSGSWTQGADNYGSMVYKFIDGKYYQSEYNRYKEDYDTEESTSTKIYYKIINGESVEDRMEVEEYVLKEGTTDEYITINKNYTKVSDDWQKVE